jgi:hypothetical protein
MPNWLRNSRRHHNLRIPKQKRSVPSDPQAARCRVPMAYKRPRGTPSRGRSRRRRTVSLPQHILYYALVIVSLGLFGVCTTALWWMLHA